MSSLLPLQNSREMALEALFFSSLQNPRSTAMLCIAPATTIYVPCTYGELRLGTPWCWLTVCTVLSSLNWDGYLGLGLMLCLRVGLTNVATFQENHALGQKACQKATVDLSASAQISWKEQPWPGQGDSLAHSKLGMLSTSVLPDHQSHPIMHWLAYSSYR